MLEKAVNSAVSCMNLKKKERTKISWCYVILSKQKKKKKVIQTGLEISLALPMLYMFLESFKAAVGEIEKEGPVVSAYGFFSFVHLGNHNITLVMSDFCFISFS